MEENWSNRTTEYRSSCKRDARKDLEKNGLHQGKSNSNEPQIGGRQKRSTVRGLKDTSNDPSDGGP